MGAPLEAIFEKKMNQVQSLCPECLKIIPAVIRETAAGVVMEKVCPNHGPFQATISTDLETYDRLSHSSRKVTKPLSYGTALDRGCPDDCGLCSVHEQHTCLAILEVTSRCDLMCPICLASAEAVGRDLSLEAVEYALQTLLRREGHAIPLQLSGGEPTLHGDPEKIIRLAASLGFKKIEIDSHGLGLSRDPFLAEKLREAGLSGVYLQIDGLTRVISELIRGKDLVEEKLKAVENCKRAGLQVVLSVTVVPGVNDQHLWSMVRFGIEQKLTGINFQPLVRSGRFPKAFGVRLGQFTVGHFLHEIERQSDKRLLVGDLSPIPCPDPRCSVITYALIHRGELVPLNRVYGEKQLMEPLADLSDWGTMIGHIQEKKLVPCGCSGSCGPGEIDGDLFLQSDFFSIGCHGMMDAENFDLERARRCCVHELTPEGRLIPFCLYNIKYRQRRGCC